MEFIGAVALAQSNGKNILFDTGVVGQADIIIKALRDEASLEICDIDEVVISHGHSDHYGNVNIVGPDVSINSWGFTIRGTT